jgi:hypothetical protein
MTYTAAGERLSSVRKIEREAPEHGTTTGWVAVVAQGANRSSDLTVFALLWTMGLRARRSELQEAARPLCNLRKGRLIGRRNNIEDERTVVGTIVLLYWGIIIIVGPDSHSQSLKNNKPFRFALFPGSTVVLHRQLCSTNTCCPR